MPEGSGRLGGSLAAAALCALLASASLSAHGNDTDRTADESPVELLRAFRAALAQHGPFTPELLTTLRELGDYYAQNGQCDRAVPVLHEALTLSRRLHGVLDPAQLDLLDALSGCYIDLDHRVDFERTQRRALLIHETVYGRESIELLPALEHSAVWYEEAGLYPGARALHDRAIRIVRTVHGGDHPQMVPALRGLARTYRLEFEYQSEREQRPLNATGERVLLRALRIMRAHPDADRAFLLDTLTDLGDWSQRLGARREALAYYREVSMERSEQFSRPAPVLLRTARSRALRGSLSAEEQKRYRLYTADVSFGITREGRVTDVVVLESDAPEHVEYSIVENLRQTTFRPRFVEGEPVDTLNVHRREQLYVAR